MNTTSQEKQSAKVLLAFSGGLDTSFCIPYLQQQGHQVITVTVNAGGFSKQELKKIAAKSKELGAEKHYEIDARQDLYDQFASYIIKANYLKGGVYPACVGPERTIIVEKIAEIAAREKSNIIAHGSTGAGNDQVRFDIMCQALLPHCTILAPIRDEGLTRAEEVAFLKKHGHPVSEKTKHYSVNIGLLGTTVGGKETHDTEKELPDNAFPTVQSLEDTPKNGEEVTLAFEKGLPAKLNGKKMTGIQIIQELNRIAAHHGFGKDYHIGTTIIGLKARIGFEASAMKVLIKAHAELEKTVLTSKQLFWKDHLGNLYGNLLHEGLACEPLREDIEAFLDSVSRHVDGTVTLKVQQGVLTVVSIHSEYSLLNTEGVYGEETGTWDGADGKAFCKLYGLESVDAFILRNRNNRRSTK